jgi:hypothetical protein
MCEGAFVSTDTFPRRKCASGASVGVLRESLDQKMVFTTIENLIFGTHFFAQIITLCFIPNRDIRIYLFPFNDFNQIIEWVSDEEPICTWDEYRFLRFDALLFHP